MTLATRMTESRPAKRSCNPWPIAIILYFVVFAGAMVTWIVYASRQRMELVGADYYEKEILFQQQIDAANRTRQLPGDVAIAYNFTAQTITIKLPVEHTAEPATGIIHFYRPSDARLDHDVKLAVAADGTQRLDASKLAPGLWKVRLSWKFRGADYYRDEKIVTGIGS